MRKVLLFCFVVTVLASCGDKKKENEIEARVVKDKYALVIDAIYEKDDSISVVYQKDKYFKYDQPVGMKIKGSPTMQRITVDFPEGEAIENISFVASTNKDQPYLTIKNISVKNGSEMVFDGDNYKHTGYFLPDTSFSWDLQKSRFNIVHTGKYPPGMVGSEQLIALLAK